jgi:hypothetical protein
LHAVRGFFVRLAGHVSRSSFCWLSKTIFTGGYVMTAGQINRAVSRATGETVREIRHLGFSLADSLDVEGDLEYDDRLPQVIDWDEQEAIRAGHQR